MSVSITAKLYFRTSVIKVINSGASVSVFYCDFGYYQTLSLKQLFPLDEEFMKLPYQALKAKLAGIVITAILIFRSFLLVYLFILFIL